MRLSVPHDKVIFSKSRHFRLQCAWTILILVTTLLTFVKAESHDPLRKTSQPDNLNTVHQILPSATSSQGFQTSSIKLKKCEGLKGNKKTETIPTFFLSEWDYYLIDFQIDGVLKECPTRKKPERKGVKVMSQESYVEIASSAENQTDLLMIQYFLLRNDVFLLNDGYLSVGENDTAWYYSPNEFCIEDVKGSGETVEVEFRTCEFDKKRPILPKCCPYGTVLNSNYSCHVPTVDAGDLGFLDKNSLRYKSTKDANPVFASALLSCEARETWIFDNCTFVFHPVTDNRVAFVGAHRTWEFLESDVIKCFDPMMDDSETNQFAIIFCPDNSTSRRDKDTQARISEIYMITMYVGAVFHFLTALVYIITIKRQNIHGKTLLSCTTSLCAMQISLGTAHYLGLESSKDKRDSTFCFVNSIAGQYFMIAAFTWLLVVNIDLWRTFRSIRADGSKRGKRFLAYSALGWGFPLLVSSISVVLEFTFTCRASGVPIPEFGEHYCFVSPWAQGFYVYYILSFLIALSCVFAALTLFGLYSFKKDTSNLRSSKSAADKQNVILFLKLGVVMGLTWVFEVISWAATKEDNTNHIVWIILDLYNALSAILIFIIFVCKRTTLNLLEQSIPALKGITALFIQITSTFTGESSYNDNTASTGVGGTNSTSKRSFELGSLKKAAEGSTNNGFQPTTK